MSGDSLDNCAIKMFGRGSGIRRREKLIMNDAETTRVSRASVSPNCPQYFTVSTVHVASGLCHAMRSNELARELRREILNFRFRFGVRSVPDRCKLESFRGYRK